MGEFQVNPNADEELKEKILSSVNRAFTGEATNRWIVAMKDDTIVEAEETVATGSKENHLNTNMAAIIDRLFDNFKRYAFEFNRSQPNRELVINCERPASMRTQAEYSEMGRQIKFCLGHLSSRNWALVVQGEENRVRAYVTPVEYLVGFRPNQKDFEPYIEMKLMVDPSGSSRDLVWTIDNQLLAIESLPALSRRLFGQLVKVCRGEAEHTERFLFDPHELRSQQVEALVQRPYDEEDDAMFFTQDQKSRAATLKSEPAQAFPSEFKAQSEAQAEARLETKIDARLETKFDSSSAPREDMASRTFVVASAEKAAPVPAPAAAPAPVSVPPPAPASGFAPPSAAPQPSISQGSNAVSSGPSAGAAEINRKVAHGIKNLFDTVDTSIHSLTALGVEAMHDDDLAAVSSIMKQTKTLKGLRDGIVQLSKDWQKSLEE
jgi:hypothetical protein